MPDTWYVRSEGKSNGPFAAAELRNQAAAGALSPDTPVSPDGKEWVRAADVAGLFDAGRKTGPALALSKVVKRFGPGRPPIIQVDDFTVAAGEQMVLAGPSGAGKTTLLNLIAGLLEPDSGTVTVDGTMLSSLSGAARDRFRGGRIGIVFQTFNLVQGLSAENNILLALMFGKLPAGAHHKRARELLARVGLDGHAHKRPAEMSVGQQQRVAIARALANRPALVLADEPAANLDVDNARTVAGLLKEVCSEAGATLMVVAHDAVMLNAFGRVVDIAQFKPKA